MKEILQKIINENSSYKWKWVKDGWGYDMITTKTKGYTFDVCIDLRSESLAFIYIFKGKDCVMINTSVTSIKAIILDVIVNGYQKYKNSSVRLEG